MTADLQASGHDPSAVSRRWARTPPRRHAAADLYGQTRARLGGDGIRLFLEPAPALEAYLCYKLLAVICQKWQLVRRHFLWWILFVRIARILYVTIKVFLITSDFAGDATA
jgi:hypothetical protein